MIRSNGELLNWKNAYDYLKYPFGIYRELVIENADHPRKIELMGAWKTGSLRTGNNGNEYRDKNGNLYFYTNRWSDNAPVGYKVWNEVSNNQQNIKNEIPKQFPIIKPEVVLKLQANKGFGIIWALFVLHCFYPETYPLYDQHVYRAYKYIITEGKECPNLAPDNWSEYLSYRNFFSNALNTLQIPFWELDRALWAYGKHIKQHNQIVGKKVNEERVVQDSSDLQGWIHSTTLRVKAKSFWWRIGNNFCELIIKRKFTNGFQEKIIAKDELSRINDYFFVGEWVPLANNVEKLKNNTEKDGLGKFLYNNLGWSVTDSQLASHLGVIFSLSSVWEFNGQKRGIKFRRISLSWEDRITKYYFKALSDDL